MKYSQIFTKTKKQAPADEVSKNAQLLIRAGYVYKEMAGVYDYLPLGLKVIENIKSIIRQEMNAIGGDELVMSSLQNKAVWESTGRWSEEAVDVWFKSSLQDGTDIGFGWSHEEPILAMMKQYIESYKDLPVSVYQFQTKMRNELRAKSGIMRGREFVMKDMYSLHSSQEDMDKYYDRVIDAYKRIFDRLGIGDDTYITFASGGAFTKFSHEFQTVCDAGEDVLYISDDGQVAVNEEVLDDATEEIGIDKALLSPVKTAEVGNIFKFGTEKSEKMGIKVNTSDGGEQFVYLASYGIGVTRVMGVIAEKMSDEKGLVWPENIAPFRVYLTTIGQDEAVISQASELYKDLTELSVEVLWDDRDARPGEKFADADLLGFPHRVVISPKTLQQGSVEYKARTSTEVDLISIDELKNRLNLIN